MQSYCLLAVCSVILLLTNFCDSVPKGGSPRDIYNSFDWLEHGRQEIQRAIEVDKNRIENKAENSILFIGDGLSISTTSATRTWNYQKRSLEAMSEALLSYEQFPYVALSMTYNTDAMPPDSAGTATALLTGHKTRLGVINASHKVVKKDCEASKLESNRLRSIIQEAQEQGKWTGIVTNTRLTHATPATAYAYSAYRNWESNTEGTDCEDIATQMITGKTGKKLRVMLGGGREKFLTNTTQDPEYPNKNGSRTDDVDLFQKWINIRKHDGLQADQFAYVWNNEQFNSIDKEKVEYLLGSFEMSHMQYECERDKGPTGEPSLAEMVQMAIGILKKSPKGFILVVEGGRIDMAHHKNYAEVALRETEQFSSAVQTAVDMTQSADTLIITTADHSHVFNIAGYNSLNKDILGISDDVNGYGSDLTMDGKHMLNLGYLNGPGFLYHRYNRTALMKDPTDHNNFEYNRVQYRADPDQHLSDNNDQKPFYSYDAGIPLQYESHGGEEVAIYGRGPFAHLLQGTYEQTYVAHLIRFALCLGAYEERCLDNKDNNKATTSRQSIYLIVLFVFISNIYSILW